MAIQIDLNLQLNTTVYLYGLGTGFLCWSQNRLFAVFLDPDIQDLLIGIIINLIRFARGLFRRYWPLLKGHRLSAGF